MKKPPRENYRPLERIADLLSENAKLKAEVKAAQARIRALEAENAALRVAQGGLRMEGRLTPMPYEVDDDDDTE